MLGGSAVRSPRPTRMKRVADPLLKFCTQGGEALDKVSDAAKQYAHGAADLAKHICILPGPEYRRLRDEVENLRLDAERVREVYRNHRDLHGC